MFLHKRLHAMDLLRLIDTSDNWLTDPGRIVARHSGVSKIDSQKPISHYLDFITATLQ